GCGGPPCDPIVGCCDPTIGCCDPIDCGPIGPPGGPGGGGGGHPNPPRKGGVRPNTETLGLPGGLNTSPLGNLGYLFGLVPNLGFGCAGDFVRCGSLGPFGNSVIGVDDAAEVGICIAQPEVCALVAATALILYYYETHQVKSVPTYPDYPECTLFAAEFDGSKYKCRYECPGLGELCSHNQDKCP